MRALAATLAALTFPVAGCDRVTVAARPAEHAGSVAPRAPVSFVAVPAVELCITSGRVEALGAHVLQVDVGGMRGALAGGPGDAVELAFTYRGPSRDLAPLASGEVRRQIGVKLRARDTCNVVYVMWHIEPTSGVFVSVKHNPGESRHSGCGAGGYVNLRPRSGRRAAPIHLREPHTLRAVIDGGDLRVTADGALAWEGALPPEAQSFDGPVGIRSDNGAFDLEVRVPAAGRSGLACPGRIAE